MPTVCLTSPQPNNDRLAGMLRVRGITVWQIPVLKYAPPQDDYAALDHAISELPIFSHAVFTSPQAVTVFQERLENCGDAQVNHLQFAVVGESTAQLCAEHGFPVHHIPQAATSRALGELLALQLPAGSRILFPQAEGGREEFVAAMAGAKAELTVVPAYRTVPIPVDLTQWQARLGTEDWQGLVITSPKGLRTFSDLFGHAWVHEVMEGKMMFMMGTTTEQTAQQLGFTRIKAPAHATLESLSQCVGDYFSTSR